MKRSHRDPQCPSAKAAYRSFRPDIREAPAAVVTRSLSVLTNVWLVDGEESASVQESVIGTITALTGASDGACGLDHCDRRNSRNRRLAVRRYSCRTGAGDRAAAHRGRRGGRCHHEVGRAVAVAIGDSAVTFWVLGAASRCLRHGASPPGLADYLVVAVLGEHTVVAAAGLEGAHVWLAVDDTTLPRTVASVGAPVTTPDNRGRTR